MNVDDQRLVPLLKADDCEQLAREAEGAVDGLVEFCEVTTRPGEAQASADEGIDASGHDRQQVLEIVRKLCRRKGAERRQTGTP